MTEYRAYSVQYVEGLEARIEMTAEKERIGAVLKGTEDTIWLIGYGTYVGDEVPPEGIRGLNLGIPNPKLVMDDGSVAWGCECWWGPEDKIKAMVKDKTIVDVDMDTERAKHND